MTYGNELNRMMKYLDRDDISKADRERKDAIIAIVDELKKKKKHVQLIKESFDIQGATDVDIKRWIKIWNKEDNQN